MCQSFARLRALARGGLLTVDESVEDELAVLLHKVVDVSENATVQNPASVSEFSSNWAFAASSRLGNRAAVEGKGEGGAAHHMVLLSQTEMLSGETRGMDESAVSTSAGSG